jgi:outer membrane lipopolysaccharide assembly protein LptE/RlpB
VQTPSSQSVSPLLTELQSADKGGNGQIVATSEIGQQEAEQLLMQLDSLSDEEVNALLDQLSQEEDGQARTVNEIDQHKAEQLLAQLDSLSDEDVDLLLGQMLEKGENA